MPIRDHQQDGETDAREFIVAEVSKNWRDGQSVADTPILAVQFELCIAVNLARGYELHSWKLHRMMTAPKEMNETIFAVFKKQPYVDPADRADR